jgi:hypothetical protein
MLRIFMKPLDLVIATINKGAELLGYSKVIAMDFNEVLTAVTKAATNSASNLLFDPERLKLKARLLLPKLNKKQIKAIDGFLLQMKQGNAAATGRFFSSKGTVRHYAKIEETNRLMEEGRAKRISHKI